jgi:hypothetical protein
MIEASSFSHSYADRFVIFLYDSLGPAQGGSTFDVPCGLQIKSKAGLDRRRLVPREFSDAEL